MGAAQPLNTAISVFRRVRTLRNHSRHTTVKHMTTPFDTSVVAVPGEETEILEYRKLVGDGYGPGITDAFRYGHAVVVAPRSKVTTKTILTALPRTKLVTLPGNPRELQLEPLDNTADFYAQVANVTADTFINPSEA